MFLWVAKNFSVEHTMPPVKSRRLSSLALVPLFGNGWLIVIFKQRIPALGCLHPKLAIVFVLCIVSKLGAVVQFFLKTVH